MTTTRPASWPASPGTYFFLSYAHSPPPSDGVLTDTDHWVRIFYDELSDAVRELVQPNTGLDIGFIDYQLPPGSDWKAQLAGVLSATEVFVPLYSPGYLIRSWPMSERESFERRLAASRSPQADRHVVPVLWVPVPAPDQLPELREAVEFGAGVSEYAANGLRALRMLSSYRAQYATILHRLARRIVDVAERYPLGPSSAPTPGRSAEPVRTETPFVISVLAPNVAGARWRPFGTAQALPIAEYVANAAERLGLPTRIVDFGVGGALFETCPGVLLIDPWIAAGADGEAWLSATFARLPDWVTPLVVVDLTDPQTAERGVDLSARVAGMLTLAGAHRVRSARNVDEFVQVMPALVTEARRQYLRNAPVFPPKGPHVQRPRLAGPVPPAREDDR